MKKLLVITALLFLPGALIAKHYENMTYVYVNPQAMLHKIYAENPSIDRPHGLLPTKSELILSICNKESDEKILNLINENRQSINNVEDNGSIALGEAIIYGRTAVVKALLEAGANPNIIVVADGKEDLSFIHQVIARCRVYTQCLAIIKLLVEYGAYIDYESSMDSYFYYQGDMNSVPVGTPLNYVVFSALLLENKINTLNPITNYATMKKLIHKFNIYVDIATFLECKGADTSKVKYHSWDEYDQNYREPTYI